MVTITKPQANVSDSSLATTVDTEIDLKCSKDDASQKDFAVVVSEVEKSEAGSPTGSSSAVSFFDGAEVAQQPKDESAPPDGGYGWVCVACAMALNICSWGINGSYGVYLSFYLTHEPPLYPQATPLSYAFIGGLIIGSAMVVSPITNLLIRQFSSRVTLLTGTLLQFISLIIASFATQLWQLYLVQGALFGLGMGMVSAVSVSILPQWFDKKRSIASGIAAAGSGVGGLVFSLATNAMLQHPRIGLAWTFRITAIITFIVNIICSLLMRDRNKKINPDIRMFDVNLVKRVEFMYLVGWGTCSMLAYIIVLYSLPNYGVSVGLTQKQGSILSAMLNLGNSIGRPLIGLYSDTWGRINIAGVLTLACALTIFTIWINTTSFGVLIFFSLLNGAICGTFWTTVGPVTAEVISLKELPSGLNLIWLFMFLPLTFSEAIGQTLVQPQGGSTKKTSYQYLQIFTGLLYFVAALMVLFVRVWKIGDEDNKAVIDEFSPSVFLQAEHPSGAKVQLGNTLKVKDTQNIPNIIVTPEDARFDGEDTKYTLCLTGTDATSRENPIWGEFCHWLVTDISPKSGTLDFRDANELMRYMGPSPLKKTGKHRYVLLLFRNGSEQPHYLLDRRKWSFDVKEPRIGARYYARKYGLTLVG
ncbi:hypothetical protein Dda_7505 [Drechslerella dactyloides]|uniref:Major facilitator superfamily (MFS) profile domain-containing protein n=1 Tax=Drechslerella dactyloides TaxID=74499 RepID=A0AAD6ISP6_DREDA|nr:hypothetical protein Dda_7505 [Drechslerella dactyloides]